MTSEALVIPLATKATPADFSALYRVHLEPLLRFATLVGGDAHRAEDAVAEAFAKAYPHWCAGRVSDPGSYLRRAVVNELTSRGRRRLLEVREERRRTSVGRAAGRLDDHVTDREVVVRALRRLPVQQRAVVVLRFYEDMPEREIAEVLGLAIGTVKSHTSRGLDRLRAELEDH